MKRTLVAVALVVVFVMALATPALAQSIMHTAVYEMEGTIDFEKQMGHLCNTGAEVKQTISGNGVMSKVQTVNMVKGKITMDDGNDWVAGATPLTVTTVWELCAPPKYTYTDAEGNTGVVGLTAMYPPGYNQPRTWELGGWGASISNSDLADDWDAVSNQIWAVQVQADAGYSGNLHQTGEAAYGPFWGADGIQDSEAGWTSPGMWFDTDKSDSWRWETDGDGVLGANIGSDFVGVYFSMEQHARTSMGTLKRYIDISSPFGHGYLMEDMSVVGKSDVQESFLMADAPKGEDIVGTWWDLF